MIEWTNYGRSLEPANENTPRRVTLGSITAAVKPGVKFRSALGGAQ